MKGTYRMAPSYSCPSCNANMAKTARTCYKCGWDVDDERDSRLYRSFKLMGLIAFWGFIAIMLFMLWLTQDSSVLIRDFTEPKGIVGMMVNMFFCAYSIIKFFKYGRKRYLMAVIISCIATYFIHYAVALILGILYIKWMNRRRG